MLKKIMTMILACVMLVANGSYVFANVVPTLRVETSKEVEKGQKLNVDLYLDAPQGIKTLEFSLNYDPEVLTLEAANMSIGDEMSQWIYEYNVNQSVGQLDLAAVDEKGFKGNSSVKVCRLQFNVRSNASIGNTTVALKSVKSYTDTMMPTTVEVVNGYINIISPSTSGGSTSGSVIITPVVTPVHKVIATVDEEGRQVATITSTLLAQLSEKESATLIIEGSIANLTFNQEALKELVTVGAKGDAIIMVQEDASGLYPSYDVAVVVGDKSVTSLGDGQVRIELGYEAQGEDEQAIVVYVEQPDGSLKIIKKSSYANPIVSFTTQTLGNIMIGYNKPVFTDVALGAWYTDYVTYLSARGIMNGKSEGTFDPSASITRAEFVQLLANLEEVTAVSTDNTFADVSASAWYAMSVEWAAGQGIATGYEGQFNPSAPITRQEMAVMLMRYCDNVAGTNLVASTGKVTFADQHAIAPYAVEAVATLQQAGIIAGKGEQTFAPTAHATRAEVAKMMTVLVRDYM